MKQLLTLLQLENATTDVQTAVAAAEVPELQQMQAKDAAHQEQQQVRPCMSISFKVSFARQAAIASRQAKAAHIFQDQLSPHHLGSSHVINNL